MLLHAEYTKKMSAPLPSEAKRTLSLLARSAPSGIIDVNTAAVTLGRPRGRASALLSNLARTGWVTRLRRGQYFILPLEAESGATTTHHDPWLVASHLFTPCYIGGWSAAEHWGLTEQIFAKTFVVSAASVRAREVAVLGLRFVIKRVPAVRIANLTTVWRGSERVHVSSRERTLVDALRDPSWLGGVRNVADALTNYLDSSKGSVADLVRELPRLRGGAQAKRLGWLLETMGVGETVVIDELLSRKSAGYIKLDPAIRSRGKLSKRWGLWINADVHQR